MLTANAHLYYTYPDIGRAYSRLMDLNEPQSHPDVLRDSVYQAQHGYANQPNSQVNTPVSLDVVWTQLRYHSAALSDLRTDVHEVKSSIATLILELAKMPNQYAQTPGVQQLAQRIDSLESTRDATTPILQQVQAKQASVEARVDALTTYKERQSGGSQWLFVAVGLFFTFAGIVIALLRFIVPPT